MLDSNLFFIDASGTKVGFAKLSSSQAMNHGQARVSRQL